ncbi:DUF58 domain-containing protein [Agromyces aerolatus]|uniref:DUF58 domain-containing protein n=1 Tax=Agromyces sp. LY-1074 TaxID=3074080 RepID=UPI00285EDAB2|nr:MULTISPECIES: DUF58 domain-containing protein [unclassified Agromyces]MDR5699988.1 DUF58 domain-containing protein [Agromyces sp. LY-1074]MDR5706200.1 DUF58 domain-containing protein [Agromyces sp. LY-1358]
MPRARASRAAALPRLTRRGGTLLIGGLVLFGVTLWFDSRDVMLLAFVGIVLPLVALVYVAFSVPRLAVRRSFVPAVVEAGSVARVSLVVQNRARRAFDGARWSETVPPGVAGPPESVLPALGAWEQTLPSGDDTARLEYRIRPGQRGVYEVGPLRVTTTDPFGLARVSRDAGTPQELVVTPQVIPLDPAVGTAAAVDGVLHGLQRRTHPNADEFIAREYRHGDPLRRVHWPATARRGELMVRDEEQRGDPEARLVLDTTLAGRADHGSVRTDEDRRHFGFELAVEIVASVGVHLIERGFRLRADRLDDPVHGALSEASVDGYRLPGGDRQLLEDLARLANPCVARRRRHADGAPLTVVATEARMPGYAVLVDPDATDAQHLVALRPALSPAIAFAVPGVDARVVEALEEADWQVVVVRRIADLAGVWEELGHARGSAAHRSGQRGADAS